MGNGFLDLQEQLFKAVETIVNGKLDSMPISQCLECIVNSTQNPNGSYAVIYNDSEFEAYPVANASYKPGDIVYVFAIDGDLSKKKLILSNKSFSGQQYINLTEIIPSSIYGHNYIKKIYQNREFVLNSGTSEVSVEVDDEDFLKDIAEQTNIVIAAEIESDLTPTIGARYGFGITLLYEDGIQREYILSLNEVTGNPTKATGYQNTIEDLYQDSKAVKIISCKMFISGFNTEENKYLKFNKIKIGFVEETVASMVGFTVTIDSSTGTTFKNNEGSTRLTAKLFKGTGEVDVNGESYVYTWTKRDKDGEQVYFASGDLTKTGKTIVVDAAVDITADGKNIFEVEVTTGK